MLKGVCLLAVVGVLAGCSRVVSEEPAVYLDYASSCPVDEGALKKFVEVSKIHGNSSGISQNAKHLKALEEQAKQVLGRKINAKPHQIHFTAGATISNNIAILGVAYKHPKCHLITSKIEHKSVLNIFKHLEKLGYHVTYLDVDKQGKINLNQLIRSIRRNTKLISIQMVNSEIGTKQDIETIGKIAKNITFHVDGTQAFCRHDIDIEKMNIDMLTIAGHKIGAPKGVGGLYVRDQSNIMPIMFGSSKDIFCLGTRSTALITSFATAVENFESDDAKIKEKYQFLTVELSKIRGVYVVSCEPSHIISVAIEGVLLDDILSEMKDFSFSAGCSCSMTGRSNVIQAIDPREELPDCIIRISFSTRTSQNELKNFVIKLDNVVQILRSKKIVGKGCQ